LIVALLPEGFLVIGNNQSDFALNKNEETRR
jgi:hypothetical protein